jgi:hypothetical protein
MELITNEQNAVDAVTVTTNPNQGGAIPTACPEDTNPLLFPTTSLVGSIGDLAITLSENTEVPPEFVFAAGLTALGSLCSPYLSLDVGFKVQPRLYTVLLGNSADVKKSTALAKVLEFFKTISFKAPPGIPTKLHTLNGVGSAEGLARELKDHSRLLLAYDELKALVDKFQVQGSSLLSIITSLFEANTWQNATKKQNHSLSVDAAHLSLVGCSTRDTYASMWRKDAISIGLPNRLFVVNAERRPRVAWPVKPDVDKLC